MKKAMTILEIMIAIVLVGILLSFAAPQYSRYIERSHGEQAKKAMKIIQHAAKLRFVDTNNYAAAASNNLNATYGGYVDLSSYDSDPYWNYSVDANGNIFSTRSSGKYADDIIRFNEDGSCDSSSTTYPFAGKSCVSSD